MTLRKRRHRSLAIVLAAIGSLTDSPTAFSAGPNSPAPQSLPEGIDGSWIVPSLVGPPLARRGQAAVYDSKTMRVLLLGGFVGRTGEHPYDVSPVYANRIWELRTHPEFSWQETSMSIPNLEETSAFYDLRRDELVVAGGRARHWVICDHPDFVSAFPRMTRVFDLASAGHEAFGPAPNLWAGHAGVYDPTRDRLLLYGGYYEDWYCDHLPVRQTHVTESLVTLSLSQGDGWQTLKAQNAGPGPLTGHSAVYDPAGDRMIVFGGKSGVGAAETWSLWLSPEPRWERLSIPGDLPPPTQRHAAIYDLVRERMVVFGGLVHGLGSNETWELSLAGSPEWRRLAPAGNAPPANLDYSAVYDEHADRMIVFGGENSDQYERTWILHWGNPIQRISILVTPGVVHPGSPGSVGLTTVVLLSHYGFDPAAVALETITSGSARPVALGAGGHTALWTDVNRDGVPDLTVRFRTGDLALGADRPWVRLRAQTTTGRVVVGEAQVRTVPALSPAIDSQELAGAVPPRTLAVRHMTPSLPQRTNVGRVAISSPQTGRVRLDLVDVRGSLRASRDLGVLGPGEHTMEIRRVPNLAPGVYWIRVRQGQLQASTKWVVIN